MKNALIAIAAGLAALAGAAAYAASALIEGAKADCVIGEQIDGYLGVVSGKSPSQQVVRELRSVNQQRKGVYADLAQRNGVTVEVTAKLTAEKLINQAPKGQCVQNGAGEWVKK